MKEFTLNGIEFTAQSADEDPILAARLIAECERINNANPELVRLNKNTWVKKTDKKP